MIVFVCANTQCRTGSEFAMVLFLQRRFHKSTHLLFPHYFFRGYRTQPNPSESIRWVIRRSAPPPPVGRTGGIPPTGRVRAAQALAGRFLAERYGDGFALRPALFGNARQKISRQTNRPTDRHLVFGVFGMINVSIFRSPQKHATNCLHCALVRTANKWLTGTVGCGRCAAPADVAAAQGDLRPHRPPTGALRSDIQQHATAV